MKDLAKKLFVDKTDHVFLQFFRFIFVGGTAFLIDFFIYFALVEFVNVNYLIAATIAFFISVYLPLSEWPPVSILLRFSSSLSNLLFPDGIM